MVKYENDAGEFLKIKIKEENFNSYWLFIELYSNSIDPISYFGLNLDCKIFVKNNMVYNSHIMAKEGRNAIYATLHCENANSIPNEESFISLTIQSYFQGDDNNGTKKIGYNFVTKDTILKEISDLAEKLNINTSINDLTDILFPSLPEIINLLSNADEKTKETTFFRYQEKVNKILMPLRQKVHTRKHKRYK